MRPTNRAEPPRVQVFVPTFNQKKFISEALDSILSQKTNFPVHILVHDDASTDGTQEIVQSYVEAHPQSISAILQEENQMSQGRRIFEIVWPYFNAKYIAFLDGDDVWIDPEKLRAQVDFMERHPGCALVQPATQYFSDPENRIVQSFPPQSGRKKRLFLSDFAPANFVQTSAAMLRLKALNRLPDGFSTLPFGDYAVFSLVARRGWVGFIDREMVKYRIHQDNWWVNKGDSQRQLQEEMTNQVKKFIVDNIRPIDRDPWLAILEGRRLRGFARARKKLLKAGRLAHSFYTDMFG